ncbi:hypothetical protein [Desulfoplanes formicivorans]|uniref:Uncharacterized protein n=1 Tax=Desulfoplanes formicivorans TaxID=1592317 RepID=A0A194AH98_9BACT|nr:hypothetical protein [Desulfoplanes formicivorans]GAU08461.1 hypothetical protein DPF_1171 [Desulfoplanes formicivorans]
MRSYRLFALPFVFLCLFVLLWGCATLPTPPLVHPSRAGSDLDLAAILEHVDQYQTYFSARSFNPSGLLFVPRNSPFVLIPENRGLGQGWNPVEDPAAITTMVALIRERDRLEQPALKALLRPLDSGATPTRDDILGYVFSARSTYARKMDDDPVTYKVYQIPEIPRMGNRDEKGFLWRGGFRR